MRIALVQMCSGRDRAANLERSESLIRQAASRGVHWVLTPENTPFLGRDREKLAIADHIDGPTVDVYRKLAKDLNIWLTLGSTAELSKDPKRTHNTQVLIDPQGDVASSYRKIHLFDVDVDVDNSFRESDSVAPGSQPVVAQLPGPGESTWSVGLSICYDLRFPELYRSYQHQGCQVLTVPSAFTRRTGSAHWHALLRARAIENQAYVLAPNQWGHHFGNRYSFGQSAVYDPWGQLIASASDGESITTADLNMNKVLEIRRSMPVLDHRRLTTIEQNRPVER